MKQAELERRMERVRVLLSTHDEIYDSVSRNETAHAGFGDPVRRTLRCVCDGTGCGQCERSAARAAELGVDLKPGRVLVLERDAYDTGLEGAFDPAARTAQQRAALIDSTIEHLQDLELVREGVYAAHVEHEKLLDLATQRDSRGSYRELRAALESLPRTLRGEAAVRWLADYLPKQIRVPRWAYEIELERLAGQVVELKDVGLDVAEIASELAISKRQVRNAIRSAKR
jgi:hypothetical protein